jgi:hypothetical protein
MIVNPSPTSDCHRGSDMNPAISARSRLQLRICNITSNDLGLGKPEGHGPFPTGFMCSIVCWEAAKHKKQGIAAQAAMVRTLLIERLIVLKTESVSGRTTHITGRANGIGGTMRTALRALRCMWLLGALYDNHASSVQGIAM